ncbi:MAG TPA: sulfatase-like hydrolase/transferase, partial [Acidobacteriota bacterium]|nr:sulfatase-like hydrolase/transferase [Acidobacteriota bacterium]
MQLKFVPPASRRHRLDILKNLGRRAAGATNVFILLFLPHIAFAAPRNVMLITIDTWRADYLSYNGSTKVQTPHVDRLAKEGANFTKARTSVPLTLPSHASIMTGLYPPNHGVRDNGSFRLPDSHSTLAQTLKSKGYITAAFIGSFVLDHRFGLNAGFDVYDDRTWNQIAMLESSDAERNAEAVYKAFQSWWTTRDQSKPFFVWIHLYDPHAPYEPPAPFRARYKTNPYAGEVAYADSFVGKLMNDLEKSTLTGNSIVAVVGDHGEGLGEHQENSHSVLIYNSKLHVPMILFAPKLIAPATRIDSLTRTIDLASTLLDYLGYGKNFGEGTSMRNVIEGGNVPEVQSYSESLYPKLNLGWSPLFGIEAGKFHFILAPAPELYYLPTDPAETKNRLQEFPQIVDQLQDKLKPFVEKPSVARQKLDAEAEEKLRSLGYVSGAQASRQSNADPKDKMGIWNRMQQGMSFSKYGNCREAIAIFEEVLMKEKDTPLVYDYLGSCYRSIKEWDKAENVYRKALDRGLESATVRMNLGVLLHREKKLEQA